MWREVYQLLVLIILLPFLFRAPADHTPTQALAVATPPVIEVRLSPPPQAVVSSEELTKPLTIEEEEVRVEEAAPKEASTETFATREEVPEERVLSKLEEADALLWFVYERTPKADPKNFAWKDPFVAKKIGMGLKEFVIGGMQEAYRLKLASMILAMWKDQLDVGLTSCYRNDERQSMVEARRKNAPANTYHGGSARGGYGKGQACDLIYIGPTWKDRTKRNPLIWAWVDTHGRRFGMGRPFPKGDPMHVTPLESREYIVARGGGTRSATKKKRVQVASAK